MNVYLFRAVSRAEVLLLVTCAGISAQEAGAYDPEARLAELGIILPRPPEPVANYVNGVRTGNLIFLAGKGPRWPDGRELHGKLGTSVSIEEGYEGSRQTAIN